MASTIVLITGANSGIGFAITQVLVQASSRFHVIMAARSPEKVKVARIEIEATAGLRGTVSTLQLDVTDEISISEAVAAVEKEYSRIDVLINNAGVGGQSPDLKTRFELTFKTNVLGPALVTDAFRPLLLKSQTPYSLYISSGKRTMMRHALQRTPAHGNIKHMEAYQLSKAAVNMLAMQELYNYQDKGMKVFVVSPGFVRSNLRGTSEEQISGWGGAGDAQQSGELVLEILEGKRDDQMNGLVHKDGVWDW